ncbi:MAG TPA: hypothetical protein EYQ22_18270 [Gammaproteobacteria bacterium]|nr:hypothetical protein [Gammaproteobacteria bacterium]HIK68664.1 hypothetical protein [Pseudomonadales bacterium]
MRFRAPPWPAVILACCIQTQALASGLADISNYRQYSELFSSSGQPSKQQISLLANAGFQRIIYLALTSNQTALAGEDDLVLASGMEYAHIAVDFSRPTVKNFQLVAALLQQDPELKTLLHCQINLRASTFAFLYRVIFLKVPVLQAKAALDSVWVPDPVWYRFIVDTLAHYQLSPDCQACDWGEREFDNP